MDRAERYLGSKIGKACFSLDKDGEKGEVQGDLCNCTESLKVEIILSEIGNIIYD